MKDGIALVLPDPNWPALYLAARDELLAALPVPPVLVEHIGSTAVPGLAAKPVIDIIVLVTDMAPIRAALPDLAHLGYELRPDVSNTTRLFFRRFGHGGERTHHLHLHTDPSDVRRHILFRDRLRDDVDTRTTYEALKRHLAHRHAQDREAYARGKNEFVDAVVREAGGPDRRPFWT